jgi:hypothetical protein
MENLTPAYVYRRYNIDGVSASGLNKPDQAAIIRMLNLLFGVSRGGWVVAETVAELNAITPENETDGGAVLTGDDAGYYYRDGGAWVFGRGWPDSVGRVTLSGTGAAQTGTLKPGVIPANVEMFYAKVATPNTGAMTLSIGGETARDVVNVAGNALSAGEWTGVVMFFLNDDGDYQLINDAGAAAAAAQSATDAQTAQSAAEAALADFNEKYLGAFADDTAATAAAGGTPITGAEYWNTTTGKRKTWGGSSWQDTSTSLNDGDVTIAKLADALVVTETDTIAANNNDTTIPTSAAVFLHVGTARDFASVAAIKAIPDPTKMTRVGLLADGREGEFIWKSGDYASRVAADTYNVFYIENDNVAASSGAYVRIWGGHRPPVTWAGAVLDGTGNYQAQVQSILDQHGSIFIPNGTLRCTSAIQHADNTYIQFEGIAAQLFADHNGSAIEGKNKTTERRFFLTIESGKIYGGGALSVGIDMLSTTYGLIKGTWLYTMALAWKNGGSGSQSAYHNEAHGCAISTVTTGVSNGTLGNETKMFGGSIKDMVVGTEDDDNSGVLYDGVALETFTGFGGRVSNSGVAADKIRHQNCRFENPSTTGAYASATALRWNPASQNCRARDNSILTVANGIVDSGTANQESGN